ncbi:MAG: DnaD domain protein [Clostridiaceae bacterium]
MSTFLFKNRNSVFTPVSNVFIENYMPRARGEYVKVYLLGLKYCVSGEPGAASHILADALDLLETDVLNAWIYWNDTGLIKMIPMDNMGNFTIQFLDIPEPAGVKPNDVNLMEELNNSSTKDMLQDIEKLLFRPLSSSEMEMYINWQQEYDFSHEIILLLIQYCASRGKSDPRYIEKTAITWHEAKIRTVDDAQTFIKKHEDKWVKIRKIMKYLGIRDAEIMKPQEELMDKWLNSYGFDLDVIFKACNVCFERINKADFKYIDGILTSWYKEGIKSLEDISKKDSKRTYNKGGGYKFSPAKKQTVGNFDNFEQREYDYDDLEKKLLGWDTDD